MNDMEFTDSHRWTSLLDAKDINDSDIFGEYLGVVSFLMSMCAVEAIFFMTREYFRWDTFVVRSPAMASCIAAARVATITFLIFKAFQSFLYIRPLLAAAGSIACSIIILIPVSIVASTLPRGRLSSLFSYATRIIFTGIAVPAIWHVIFVENIINPVAGPVFTHSTPSSVMMCFWFVGAIVGLILHSSMDKQVRHMAPAVNQQGLLFALEALRFTFIYASVEFLLSFVVILLGNFSEIVLGEFGDFNPSLVGRMFFATAFCTFITWIGAQYVAACLDPHPSCSLSISDARLLADGSKSPLYAGHVSYRCLILARALFFHHRCNRRAYYRVRVVAAAFLRWCRCNPDRALECAFKTSEIFNPSDPVKGSIIVDAFCVAIDGYGKDLQNIKVQLLTYLFWLCSVSFQAQLDIPPFSSQSIFLFNWFWLVVRFVSFIFFGHGPDLR